jgi:hypothetical protein
MATKGSSLLAILVLFFSFSWSGCKSDEEEVIPETFRGAKVLIANQGNFGWGEGTLTVYYQSSKTVDNEVFKKKNNKSLGNVFQSISKVGDKYYFVINNSGRLVVSDTNFMEIDIVNDFVSPRYFYQTDKYTGYMTDLYSNYIYIVDLDLNASIVALENNHWSEQGVISNGTFWYTAPETNKIFSLDVASDLFQDSIVVGEKPESIVKDKDGTIWVLCRGDDSKDESGKLTSVSINGGDTAVASIGIDGVPTSLTYDAKSHTLYYLSNGIQRFRLGVDSSPKLWKDIPNSALYNAAVNPNNGDLYVSDVKDFVSKSTIYRYGSDGTLLDEFSAGIIAGDFFFP